ncbi:glycosyltransferase family 4 protein [Povalibacter sp.]|uniref:glycosyltransferase family 4 protein n=1 Tax=Povalibacter sp. TaxID=1962978 RepID=UPI002F4236D5
MNAPVALRVLMFPKQDPGNPFVRRFATCLECAGVTVDDFSYGRALRRRYDVLHVHWPDSHLVSASWWGSLVKHLRFSALIGLLRLRGTRIVWMVHNLSAHDQCHPLSRWLFPRWFPRACTHVIALTHHGLESARQRYPVLVRKPTAVVPHGHYRHEYPVAPSRADARRQLGLQPDPVTLLFFGNVRRYKNVPRLIEMFRRMPEQAVHLVIAGLPGHGITADELSSLCDGDERITLRPQFVADAEVPTYFGAADAIVLPFDSILNSGSVLLGLSFNRVVLAPRLGALPEIQELVGSQWLRLYDGPLTTEHLQEVCAAESLPSDSEVDLSAFDWNSTADRTLELYRDGATASDGTVVHARGEGASYEENRKQYSKT